MPRPKPRPPLHERAARSMRAHPYITWGSAVSIVGVLAAIVPAVMWVDARYQLAAAAESDRREYRMDRVEQRYGQAKLETLLRSNAARYACDNKQRVDQNCEQLRQEWRDAAKREQTLYEMMQRGGK